MKPEEQIDQKQLLKMIKLLNDQFKTKIKTKGSITDLAEAFATGVEALSDKPLPDEAIDFYNDLFNDESTGYKDVDVAKTEAPPEEDAPLEEAEPEPLPEEEGLEELDELEPEAELPGEEEEEPLPEEEDELEELEEEEPPPPKKGRGRPVTKKPEPKPAPKPTVKKPIEKKISKPVGDKSNPQKKKETPTMLEALQSLTKKPEIKEFVKTHSINIKLKNNESVQVWKAKVKKLLEVVCTPVVAETPEPAPKVTPKPAKKQSVKPKAAPKPEKKVVAKAKAEKPAKKAVKPRGEKDAFGTTAGSLTHAFVEAIYKKPQTMKMLIDGGIGKHPKALKKFIAMGYMERDKAGIIQMTVKGRKVYGGGK
jgi:hypothetical protein